MRFKAGDLVASPIHTSGPWSGPALVTGFDEDGDLMLLFLRTGKISALAHYESHYNLLKKADNEV